MYNLLALTECTRDYVDHMEHGIGSMTDEQHRQHQCVLAVVLDGAPEMAASWDPEAVKVKCYNFCSRLRGAICAWDGKVLTCQSPRINWVDGYVASFFREETVDSNVLSALASVRELCCQLQGHNDFCNHGWEFQLHARAAVARTLVEALNLLQYPSLVNRDQVVVHERIWGNLPHALRYHLGDAGVLHAHLSARF